MPNVTNHAARALSGIEARDEHDLRIWTAVAMWLGGGCSVAAGTLVLGEGTPHVREMLGLSGFCFFVAIFSVVVIRPTSNPTLYKLTNIFSTLGAVAVWFACFWSGGPSSGYFELYFFPVLYDAYFFRARQAVPHLVLNSLLALSPLIYASSVNSAQFPAHVAVLIAGFWGISAVVGNRKRHLLAAELSSRKQALSDPLTSLHNLRSLREEAARREPAEGTGVVAIDIDDFKAVNTAYGHTGADALLQRVGSQLLSLADEGDCVARTGGDEFAILAHGRTQLEVEVLAANCAQAVSRASWTAGGEGLDLSASVGYALCPRDGRTLSDLLAGADRAMFKTKAARRLAAAPLPGIASPASVATSTASAPSRELWAEPAVAGPRPQLARKSERTAHGKLGSHSGWAGFWRELLSRSPTATAATAAWLGAAAATLMVLLLPDSDTAHAPLVVALVLAATAMAAFMLFLAPVIGSSAYLVSDSLAVPSVALGVYLTGGTTSPLLPLIFIAVTFAAYFSTRRGALIRLLGATVVGATPFAYAAGDQRLLFVSRFIALISTAAVLVGIIVYNRRELAQAQRTARELASRDPLTGLANRRAFERHVLAGLKAARVEGDSRLSISIIDLDNFKRVNDLYGHAAGDTLLNEIASGLRAVAGQEDLVARIGGDEFALVSRGADSTSSRAAGVRCVKAVEDAVVRAGYAECDVSATVGYAIFPDHGETLTELVQAADSALMQAKDDGKHTVAGAPGPAPRFTRSEAPASAASAR